MVPENGGATTDTTAATATSATTNTARIIYKRLVQKKQKQDFVHLPTLTLSELLPLEYSEVEVSSETGNWESLVIGDLVGVKRFSDQVTASISSSREAKSSGDTDTAASISNFFEGCWGSDAEWRT
jgi:hypothetical protein